MTMLCKNSHMCITFPDSHDERAWQGTHGGAGKNTARDWEHLVCSAATAWHASTDLHGRQDSVLQ